MKRQLFPLVVSALLGCSSAFVPVQQRPCNVHPLSSSPLLQQRAFGMPRLDLMKQASDERHSDDGAQIISISSPEQLDEFLKVDDRMCVIKFYSTWCKSCQKFGLKFRSLAVHEGDGFGRKGQIMRRGQIRFGEIEFAANKELCKSLGIKRLPTVHIYKNGDLITGFSCGPKKFPLLTDKLQRYKRMTDGELKFEAAIRQVEQMEELKVGQLVREGANLAEQEKKENWWRNVLP